MFANMGRESELRDQNRRQRGRRHAPQDASPPKPTAAPFATVEEMPFPQVREAPFPQVREAPYEGDVEESMHAAPSQTPPPAGLCTDRLARGGLNLFSWNTNAPSVPVPRVLRERDAVELQRLRPNDAHAQRDAEVREKFECNASSRFLCFSENDRAARRPPRHVLPVATPEEMAAAPKFGRRRSTREEPDTGNGIAGFAGMGCRGDERAYQIQRTLPTSNLF